MYTGTHTYTHTHTQTHTNALCSYETIIQHVDIYTVRYCCKICVTAIQYQKILLYCTLQHNNILLLLWYIAMFVVLIL